MLNNIATSSFSSAELAIGEAALWSIWIIAAIVAIIFAVIFFYHWKKYDWEDKKIRTGAWIFIVGIAVLLLGSALTAFYIF